MAMLTVACLLLLPAPQGAPQPPCTQGLPPSFSAPYLGALPGLWAPCFRGQQLFQMDLLHDCAMKAQYHLTLSRDLGQAAWGALQHF